MIKTVLFGADETGAMTARLLGSEYRALCFADSAQEKWGGSLAGLPVVSPVESLICDPDCVFICAQDEAGAVKLESELRSLGYDGPVKRPPLGFDPRLAAMRLLAEQIHELKLPGDAAQLGVGRGDFAIHINAAFPDRMLHLFDSFAETGVNTVWKRMPFPEQTDFHKGAFPESFAACESRFFAFVSIDAGSYAPTSAALPLFWERLNPGGAMLAPGADKAVREFCAVRGILPTPVCDLHGSVIIRKPLK